MTLFDVNFPLLPARPASGGDMLGAYRVNSVNCCDALGFMKGLPAASVNAIITDLPYGTTACSWDEIIPFAPMWAGIKRILKPRGVFVTTASQPFTSKLVMSNLAWFKYEWVWNKTKGGMFVHAKNRPLKTHENVLVFSDGVVNHETLTNNRMNFYPQMEDIDIPYSRKYYASRSNDTNFGARPSHIDYEVNNITTRYPKTVLLFSNESNEVHPTQKPVDLYEYLIRTYTQPGELVLDFCCGSGTTLLAAAKTGRRYIGNDITPEYVKIAQDRLNAGFITLDVAEGIQQPSLFAELAG